MRFFTDYYRLNKELVITTIILVILPIIFFSIITFKEINIKTICTSGHIVSEENRRILAFRWSEDSNQIKRITCSKHKNKNKNPRINPDASNALKTFSKDETNKKSSIRKSNTKSQTLSKKINQTKSDSFNSSEVSKYSGELIGLIPNKLEGYKTISETPGKLEASRTFAPGKTSTNQLKNDLILTIQATRCNTDKEAIAYINNQLLFNYPVNKKTESIKGINTFMSTNGNNAAVLYFNRNGIVYTLEMLTNKEEPANLYDELKNIVSKFI